MENQLSILQALQNTRSLLESLGYRSGDIHDDLQQAIEILIAAHPKVAAKVMPLRVGC
jgi:hypothetical protein